MGPRAAHRHRTGPRDLHPIRHRRKRGAQNLLSALRLHGARAGWSPDELTRSLAEPGRPLPTLDFIAEPTTRAAHPRVYKTHTTTRATLANGVFRAREVQRRVPGPNGVRVVRCAALAGAVPPGQRFGYDVIAHAGLARFLRQRQRDEIREELRTDYGVPLSAGTLSNLCDRFLLLLEGLHFERIPKVYAAAQVGYPLHLDATCEKGRGGLALTVDGRRRWVLNARRIPSEDESHLGELVRETAEMFGAPVATMSDLGKAVGGAVAPLRERGIPDFVCHYHFVRAVGMTLFERPREALLRSGAAKRVVAQLSPLYHRLLREADLRAQTGARIPRTAPREKLLSLLLWLREGPGTKPAPFPFEVPEFELVRRGRRFAAMAEQLAPEPRNRAEREALDTIGRVLTQLKEPAVVAAFDQCEEAWNTFNELRGVLRLTEAELPRSDGRSRQPDLPALEQVRRREIEKAVREYRLRLAAQAGTERALERCRARRSPAAIVLSYLDEYEARLFGHPAFYGPNDEVLGVMDRTDNLLEQMFGAEKRKLRRRLGKAHLARDLELMPAQAALAANLRYEDYVRALCGSIENLPAAFADVDRGGRITRKRLPRSFLARLVAGLRAVLKPRTRHDAPRPNSARTRKKAA